MRRDLSRLASLGVVLLACGAANGVTISDIQGPAFLSPYAGRLVHDVAGVVAAKDAYGFWIIGEPTDDLRVSNGIRVYGRNVARSADVGDLVSLSGRVVEYRNPARPNDLSLTEIENPTNIRVHSSGHSLIPVILGEHRTPPRSALSALDKGPDGWLSVPGNVSSIEAVNAMLDHENYGIDFWESLEGQLVTIKSPTAVSFPDRFGSFWVHGGWPVNGKNERGGLSLAIGPGGVPHAHSEAILVGRALDKSRNPRAFMGVNLADITGIVTYQFGFYTLLPLTAPKIVSEPHEAARPADIYAGDDPCEITIGDYNVENMSPRSHHIPLVASHIVQYLHSPSIVFLQEIVDDSGAANNGVVSANRTLSALVKAIEKEAGNGVKYEFVNVDPENNVDGGKPGSNIRVAYLWRPEKVSLVPGSVRGNATQATSVVEHKDGMLTLSPNPGRIDPLNVAWTETRKPLAAAWQTASGARFFTVNVHLSSKRFSTSTHGDARPPINGRSEQRTAQVGVVARFVGEILAKSKEGSASVVVGGDMNEFTQTRSVFRPFTGPSSSASPQSLSPLLSSASVSDTSPLLHDVNALARLPDPERYTYLYDQHTQEIDQMFVSSAIARRGGVGVEHVHVNTWARSAGERASDHDPSVARMWVCEASSGGRDVPRLVEFEEEGVGRERLTLVADEDEEDDEGSAVHELKFNKWLMAVQCALGPLFCVAILFANTPQEPWILLATGIAGTAVGILVAVFSHQGDHPAARLARCTMGFIVSIVWIMAIADEVVEVLQTFGLIFGLSDAIIGLTIFAVGNSLADLVANMSVAVFAPIMGFSACFGGPMLNILLGIGISGTYIIRQTNEPYPLEFSTTLVITSTGLLALLVATLVFVPWNGYVLTRKWGVSLIVAYTLLMAANIVAEATMEAQS